MTKYLIIRSGATMHRIKNGKVVGLVRTTRKIKSRWMSTSRFSTYTIETQGRLYLVDYTC